MIAKKLRIILVLVSFSVCLGLMSSTYSRYVADTTGNIEVLFAKWQILVNTTDITSNTSSTINFVPVIEENLYVKNNTVAPSSKGYFDIAIDPSNVDVTFDYTIDLAIVNENMPDLVITKYAKLPNTYIEGDSITLLDLTENSITETLTFDKVTEGYFKVVVLLFLAARLARSHSKEFGKECAYIAAGFSLGLITKAIYKNQVWTTLFLLGIIAIEVVNLELSDQIGGADLTQFIPPFESIDSKFSLDPTNW